MDITTDVRPHLIDVKSCRQAYHKVTVWVRTGIEPAGGSGFAPITCFFVSVTASASRRACLLK